MRAIGTTATTVFLPWVEVLDIGLRNLAEQALAEPGVASVELLDDCRSRILFLTKPADVLAEERAAAQEEEQAAEHPAAEPAR
ncbi:hypothetical protein BBK14_18735 [Parafrankia soli]|uniref:Uncharacterized protein n=1 Tax=Parafrankia soli TaxID=2599596 RepID=A0A1S1Q719_9ACTN|nr:hypothetical protein [Parafrankia soli]OHV27994.1 hypothetical protein BBK14_18735 [Parafrankia soli]